MSKALISILVPFKNTQEYIGECVISIIKQTYPNWEAIFVDDASNDKSLKIVKDFADKEHRIKIFKNQGKGIISALQTAFRHCKGDYITRMDSDDIMVENRLSVMLEGLLKHGGKHLAVGQVKYFKKDGVSDGYMRYEKWINSLTANGTNYNEIYKECVIPSPCWMIDRKDFINCEGFDSNRYPEDYDLTFRFYRAGYKCIPCDQVLLHWRDYSTRTSRTHEHYAINYFLEIKVHYFLELDYDEKRPLTIWGAGNKGKTVAKLLIKEDIPFYWICNNTKKIGKTIYDHALLNFEYLSELHKPQSIVTVANEDEQLKIKTYLQKQNMKAARDYFLFC